MEVDLVKKARVVLEEGKVDGIDIQKVGLVDHRCNEDIIAWNYQSYSWSPTMSKIRGGRCSLFS